MRNILVFESTLTSRRYFPPRYKLPVYELGDVIGRVVVGGCYDLGGKLLKNKVYLEILSYRTDMETSARPW